MFRARSSKQCELNIDVPSCREIKESTSVSSAYLISESTNSAFNHVALAHTHIIQMETALKSRGYQLESINHLAQTLQGSICKTLSQSGTSVIKATEKAAHHKRIALVSDRVVSVQEDILRESFILQYLTRHNPPSSLAKFVDFFSDSHNYYLCMDFGGDSLFDFVKQSQQYIRMGVMDINTWQAFCKMAMLQMVELIHWLHETMNCCHLDISLENFVIDNIKTVMSAKTNKIIKFEDNFQIKLIDFGVAKIFSDNEFRCFTSVGKTGYMAPEVYEEQPIFDGRSADCWSLGVTFFMMVFGVAPFNFASHEDAAYELITSGLMGPLLNGWNILQYATPNTLHLLEQIFVEEEQRIDITQIHSMIDSLID